MKSITYREFLEFVDSYYWNQPYRKSFVESIVKNKERWTALDVLELEEIPAKERLWLVLWEEFIDPKLLNDFACLCAERALSRIEHPDPRSVAAIEAKRKWMRGEISDCEMDIAMAFARDAMRDDESDSAPIAVWAAAWAAYAAADKEFAFARATAWVSSWASACAYAWVAEEPEEKAARDDADIAERTWQVAELKKMLRETECDARSH